MKESLSEEQTLIASGVQFLLNQVTFFKSFSTPFDKPTNA
jgi:hypothetical protein